MGSVCSHIRSVVILMGVFLLLLSDSNPLWIDAELDTSTAQKPLTETPVEETEEVVEEGTEEAVEEETEEVIEEETTQEPEEETQQPKGTTPTPVPTAPTDLSLSLGTPAETTITISWSPVTGEFYRLRYKKQIDANWEVTTPDSNPYTITDLQSNTTYEVQIRAIADDRTQRSDWSNSVEITTEQTIPEVPPQTPTGFSLSLGTQSQTTITASWSAVPKATEYRIEYREISENFWREVVDSPTETSYDITNLLSDTEYQVRVRAINTSGSSDWTNVQTITTTQPSQSSTPTQQTPTQEPVEETEEVIEEAEEVTEETQEPTEEAPTETETQEPTQEGGTETSTQQPTETTPTENTQPTQQQPTQQTPTSTRQDPAQRNEPSGNTPKGNTPTQTSTSTPSPICDRTPIVQSVILAEIEGVDDCNNVTETQLSGITSLTITDQTVTALKAGDFANLTSLTELNITNNEKLTTLPSNIFNDIQTITTLNLQNNAIEELPTDIFTGLTNVERIQLHNNKLTEAPNVVGLTSLTSLQLRNQNNLFNSSLPYPVVAVPVEAPSQNQILLFGKGSPFTGDYEITKTLNDTEETITLTVPVGVQESPEFEVETGATITVTTPTPPLIQNDGFHVEYTGELTSSVEFTPEEELETAKQVTGAITLANAAEDGYINKNEDTDDADDVLITETITGGTKEYSYAELSATDPCTATTGTYGSSIPTVANLPDSTTTKTYKVCVKVTEGGTSPPPPALTPSTTPTGFSLESTYSNGNNGIVASWDAVPGAVLYNLQYRVSGTTSWTPLTNIVLTSHTITPLLPHTTYEVQVQAAMLNSSNPALPPVPGDWTTTLSITTNSTALTGLSLVGGSPPQSTITVSWNAVTGAAWYQAGYKESSSDSPYLNTLIFGQPNPTNTFIGLSADTEYTVRVTAYNQQLAIIAEAIGIIRTPASSSVSPPTISFIESKPIIKDTVDPNLKPDTTPTLKNISRPSGTNNNVKQGETISLEVETEEEVVAPFNGTINGRDVNFFKSINPVSAIVDGGTDDNPTPSLPKLDGARGVAVQGDYAYVASSNSNALEIIKVSNNGALLSKPQHISSLSNGEVTPGNTNTETGAKLDGARGVAVQGDYAYVVSDVSNALQIIDISDKANPRAVGNITNNGDTIKLRQPRGIYVDGNYAYVASRSSNALQIINISDPANPTAEGNITNNGDTIKLWGAWGVYVDGNYAYVASRSSNALQIIKVKGGDGNILSRPEAVANIADGEDEAKLSGARDVYVEGNYAYVASEFSDALQIIKVKGDDGNILSTLEATASLSNGEVTPGTTTPAEKQAKLNKPKSVYVDGDYVYIVSENSDALQIIKIRDDEGNINPTAVGSITNNNTTIKLNNPESIYVKDNYAYVASLDSDALQIINISNPSSPTAETSLSNGEVVSESTAKRAKLNNPQSVYVDGNYAYVASFNSDALQIIDISNPTNPTAVGNITNNNRTIKLRGARGVYVKDNYAYVASQVSNALQIIEMSEDRTRLTPGGNITVSGANSVFVEGNYAYVIGTNTLQIIKVKDDNGNILSTPETVGNITINGATDVFVEGNYAYVTSLNSNALQIIEMSADRTRLTQRGSIAVSGANSVYVDGSYAYVTGTNALQIIKVKGDDGNILSTPTAEGSITNNDTTIKLSGARDVYVDGNYAYVASSLSDALQIIDISDKTSPRAAGNISDGENGAKLNGAQDVYVEGNYAYVASPNSKALQIIEIPENKYSAELNIDSSVTRDSIDTYAVGTLTDRAGNTKDPAVAEEAAIPTAQQLTKDTAAPTIDTGDEIDDVTRAASIGETIKIDLSETFNDADRYTAAVSKNGVVTTSISGSTLTLEIAGAGVVNVTVTALDEAENRKSDTFQVTISLLPTISVELANAAEDGNIISAEKDTTDTDELIEDNTIDATTTLYLLVGFSDNCRGLTYPSTATDIPTVADISATNKADGDYKICIKATNSVGDSFGESPKITKDTTAPNLRGTAKFENLSRTSANNVGLGETVSLEVETEEEVVAPFTGTINNKNVRFNRIIKPVSAIVDGGTGAAADLPKLAWPQSVAVQGDYAYIVSEHSDALEIIKVANNGILLSKPQHTSSLSDGEVTPGVRNTETGAKLDGPRFVAVQGDYAYVASYISSALQIIDISDPANPTAEGSMTGIILIGDIYIKDNYAYVVSTGSNALQIINISNPANPTEEGNITNNNTTIKLSGASGVYVQGNYAYVASSRSNALQIIKIRDDEGNINPAPVRNITDGTNGAKLNGASSVFVEGNYAYVASSSSSTLQIIKVKGDDGNILSSLEATASLSNGEVTPGTRTPTAKQAKLNYPTSVFVKDNYAYVASRNSHALQVIDISNPTTPTAVGNIRNGQDGAKLNGSADVFVEGNYAYVASQYSDALQIINISDENNPTAETSLSNNEVVGETATRAKLDSPQSVAIQGNYAYVVSNRSNVLQIIEMSSDRTTLTPRGNITNNNTTIKLSGADSVFVEGDYAYVTSSSSSALQIIDISDPEDPTPAGNINHFARNIKFTGTKSVYVEGDYAYVVSSRSGALQIIEMSPDRMRLTPKGNIDDLSEDTKLDGANDVFVKDNYAYVASWRSDALQIIEMSPDRMRLTPRGNITDNGTTIKLDGASSVYVEGNYAYVVSNLSNALQIIDISDPTDPQPVGNITNNNTTIKLWGAHDVFVEGNYAYVTSSSSSALQIIDISNKANPRAAGNITNNNTTIKLGGARDMYVDGNYAYVASEASDALQIIEVPENKYSAELNIDSSVTRDSIDTYTVGTLTDRVGNTNTDPTETAISATLTKDTTAPTVSAPISDKTGGNAITTIGGTGTTVNLSSVFSDESTYTVAVTQKGIVEASISGSVLTLRGIKNGTTTVVVTALDDAKNRVSDNFLVEINASGPGNITATRANAAEDGYINANEDANNGSDKVINTPTSSDSSATYKYIAIPQSQDTNCEASTGTYQNNIPTVDNIPNTDGTYKVCISATDSSSIVSYGESDAFIRDTVVPGDINIKLVRFIADGYANSQEINSNSGSSIIISVTSDDLNATYKYIATPQLQDTTCDADTGTYGNISPAVSTIPTTDGAYKICVSAEDGAGNVGYGQSPVFVKDVSPPRVSRTIPQQTISRVGRAKEIDLSEHFRDTSPIIYTATEGTAGIVRTEIVNNILIITASSVGTTQITVTATDAARNSARRTSFRVTVNDRTLMVCSRTREVMLAIVDAVPGVGSCGAITPTHLSDITSLTVTGLTTLKVGDFDGLTDLTTLNLNNNALTSIPDGIFIDNTRLTSLNLSSNNLTIAPNIAGLTALTNLQLQNQNGVSDSVLYYYAEVERVDSNGDFSAGSPATLKLRFPKGKPRLNSNRFTLAKTPTAAILDLANIDVSNGARESGEFTLTHTDAVELEITPPGAPNEKGYQIKMSNAKYKFFQTLTPPSGTITKEVDGLSAAKVVVEGTDVSARWTVTDSASICNSGAFRKGGTPVNLAAGTGSDVGKFVGSITPVATHHNKYFCVELDNGAGSPVYITSEKLIVYVVTSISLSSSNDNPRAAKVGDTITLTITTNLDTTIGSLSIGGVSVTLRSNANATTSKTYTHSFVVLRDNVNGARPEGEVEILVSVNDISYSDVNPLRRVTIDRTAPTVNSKQFQSDGADAANAVTGDTLTLTINTSEELSSTRANIAGSTQTFSRELTARGNIADRKDGAKLDRARGVFVKDNYAYVVSQRSHALQILDISDPENLKVVGSIDDSAENTKLDGPYNVFVQGNYAYVTSFNSDALQIIKIRNDDGEIDPQPVGNIDNTAEDTELDGAVSVFVDGNYAYVASFSSNALQIIDISDPATPTPVGNITNDGTIKLREAISVYVEGDYAYVASDRSNALQIINISNKTSPTVAGNIVHEQDGAKLDSPRSVFVKGNYAYVVSQGSDALQIIKIRDEQGNINPTAVGNITHDENGAKLDSPQSVFVEGNYAYVASLTSDALQIIEISDPATPTPVGNIAHDEDGAKLDGPISVFVDGNYVYVTSGDSDALQIIELTNTYKAEVDVTDTMKGPISYELFPASDNKPTDKAGNAGTREKVILTDITANCTEASPCSSSNVSISPLNFDGERIQNKLITTEDVIPLYLVSIGLTANDIKRYLSSSATTAKAREVFSKIISFVRNTFNEDDERVADVDENGHYYATQDGLFIVKSVMGITGSALRSYVHNGTQETADLARTNVDNICNCLSQVSDSQTGQTTPPPPATPTPTGLALTAGTPAQSVIVANWVAVTGATGYHLQYKKSSESSWTTITSGITSNSHTITGLDAKTEYDVQVRATNAGGDSAWTTSQTITTALAPPAKPAAPGLSAGTDSITARWNEVTGATRYILSYKKTSEGAWTEITRGATSRAFKITGLDSNTRYQVRIRVRNTAGDSPESDLREITTTASPPTTPTGLALTAGTPAQSVIVANWNTVTGATGYHLQYKKSSESSWTTITSGITSNSHTITGLDAKTEYEVQIRATNAGGDSAWSDSSEITTALAKPAPPTFRATPTNPSQSIYSWNAIALSWITIKGAEKYELQYRVSGTSADWTGSGEIAGSEEEVAGGNRSFIISGLNPSTEYEVQVRGIDSDDVAGAWSDSSTRTTTASPPPTPTGLALTAGTDSITASWDAVTGATGYHLQYKKTSLTVWIPITSGITSNSHTITGLDEGTEYEVQVRARNSAGESAWTESQTTTTLVSSFADNFTRGTGVVYRAVYELRNESSGSWRNLLPFATAQIIRYGGESLSLARAGFASGGYLRAKISLRQSHYFLQLRNNVSNNWERWLENSANTEGRSYYIGIEYGGEIYLFEFDADIEGSGGAIGFASRSNDGSGFLNLHIATNYDGDNNVNTGNPSAWPEGNNIFFAYADTGSIEIVEE